MHDDENPSSPHPRDGSNLDARTKGSDDDDESVSPREETFPPPENIRYPASVAARRAALNIPQPKTAKTRKQGIQANEVDPKFSIIHAMKRGVRDAGAVLGASLGEHHICHNNLKKLASRHRRSCSMLWLEVFVMTWVYVAERRREPQLPQEEAQQQ